VLLLTRNWRSHAAGIVASSTSAGLFVIGRRGPEQRSLRPRVDLSGRKCHDPEFSVAPATDPFTTGKFPVCVATHDQGLRWLFDLATVLLLLDCRPGDLVLDLGAGSGFSSEMLARFGYRVVAVDPDLGALDNNRTRPRFDRSRIDGAVAVAGAVAESLPFSKATFDGVLAMNVLHHVPDLPLATAELARVLKPGCRAVFCEPGLDHMHAGETRRAVREHGETDRPFDVMTFLTMARERGFAEAMLCATLQSPLRLLPVEEVELYASGRHPRPHMTPPGVLEELQRRHAYGMLVRDGERARTSRHPGVLRAAITVHELPRELVRNRGVVGQVELANTGDSVWLSEASNLGGFVTVGCKLLRLDGRLVDDSIGRTMLPRDICPGESIKVNIPITVSESIAAGSYVLRVDLVNELITWFADLPGNEPQEFAVTIR
jgi:SAM-dependent methyltransferase